jgi:hypothetical protein
MADTKANDADAQTPGGLPQEKVEDRPVVSTVTPEDYPEKERKESNPSGS